MGKKVQRSLKDVVGEEVYSVWTQMLHEIVPDGRTHRLAPTIAAMLQFAVAVADKQCGRNPEEGSIESALLFASEGSDPKGAMDELLKPVEKLLRDSKVRAKRTSSRGDQYSVAESAVVEFVNWYNMPWES